MLIRKQFTVETAHIVRNCSSKRCSHSIHGHHAVIELFFTSNKLDNGQMIYDFGLMKGSIKDIVDSFDHALVVWDKDEELVKIAKASSDRYIILPMSSSAEAQSIMFLDIVNKILQATEFNNGEGNVECVKCIYHETPTGYAEATLSDISLLPEYDFTKIVFSDGIKEEWKDSSLWEKVVEYHKNLGSSKEFHPEKPLKNPKIKRQI